MKKGRPICSVSPVKTADLNGRFLVLRFQSSRNGLDKGFCGCFHLSVGSAVGLLIALNQAFDLPGLPRFSLTGFNPSALEPALHLSQSCLARREGGNRRISVKPKAPIHKRKPSQRHASRITFRPRIPAPFSSRSIIARGHYITVLENSFRNLYGITDEVVIIRYY